MFVALLVPGSVAGQQLVPGGVEVTPDGAAINASAGSTGNLVAFIVENTSTTTNTYTLTCLATAAVTCEGVTPASVQLTPGNSRDVDVRFTAGAAGIGKLYLRASGAGADSGNYAVTVQGQGAPVVALRNHNGDNQDRSHCLTAGAGEGGAFVCGDLVVGHGMPGYSTMGRERSLTLVYNSGTARPRPIVAASVTQPSNISAPSTVFVELEVGGVVSDTASYSGWGGATRQIAISHDAVAEGDTNGVYPFILRVQNKYSGGAFTSTVSGNLIVVNRSASVFGAGVWLAGVEQLVFNQPTAAAGGILRIGGDGSAQLYTKLGGGTMWLAPAGAFRDTLKLAGGLYTRTLRHGIQVTFDAQGRHLRTTDRATQQTSFNWNAGRLESIVVPPAGVAGTQYSVLYTGAVLYRLVDPAGRILNATITGGKLASVTDPDGLTTRFGYNADLRMTSRTGRRNFTTLYEYQKGHRLTKVTIPVGRLAGSTETSVTQFEPWDERGLGNGTGAHVAVDTGKAYTRIVGPRFSPTVPDTAAFWIDRWGAPRKIVTPVPATTTVSRGASAVPALITRVRFPDGRSDSMEYDARGNLTRHELNTSQTTFTLPVAVTQYLYADANTKDSPSRVTDPEGVITRYAYNTFGLTSQVTAPNTHVTNFVYATTGALKGMLKGVDEMQVPVWDSVSRSEVNANLHTGFARNTLGNVVSDTSPMNRVRRFTLDPLLQRVTDEFDAAGHRTVYVYDELNRVRSSRQHVEQAGTPAVQFPADPDFSGPLTTTLALCRDARRPGLREFRLGCPRAPEHRGVFERPQARLRV